MHISFVRYVTDNPFGPPHGLPDALRTLTPPQGMAFHMALNASDKASCRGATSNSAKCPTWLCRRPGHTAVNNRNRSADIEHGVAPISEVRKKQCLT